MVWIDRAATFAISLGGISVIVAVLGILVYLVIVTRPLFADPSLGRQVSFRLLAGEEARELLFTEVDEYRSIGLLMLRSGEMVAFDARDGRILGRSRLFGGPPVVTCWSRPAGSPHAAFGFEDGTVRLARLRFEAAFEGSGEAPATPPAGAWVVATLPGGEIRRTSISFQVDDPIRIGDSASPIRLMDYRASEEEARLAVLNDEGELLLNEVTRRRNMLTGATTSEVATRPVALPASLLALGTPAHLLMTSRGDQVFLAWHDGTAARFDLRDPERADLAERFELTPEPGAGLSALRFSLGEQSLLAAGSDGSLRSWFRVPATAPGGDGQVMVAAHVLPPHPAAVSALAGSLRDRTIASGDAEGRVRLHHLTSERLLAEVRLTPPSAVAAVQLTPKGDGLFALSSDGVAHMWPLINPHPETSPGSVFGKIWYEGYAAPGYTWQSSSGTDDFEPKLSLVPLIFGTLKATLYSMLFAVPIALAAAIYTSEFLDRNHRASLKSVIEMMASLPSVVLGFLAALILAPIVESWVVAVLTIFALVPITGLLLGYLAQALPPGLTRPLSGRLQLPILIAGLLGAVALSPLLASVVERGLFQGDFRAWLDGRAGTGAPGIGVMSWPLLLIGLLAADRLFVAQAMARRLGCTSRRGASLLELAKFLAILAASLLLAWLAATIGSALGLDPRGDLVGTYVQRNALVVGFVMGFAVIPIIYTIAEDALSSVPQTLRSASLGCGATRWQTATRVVLPVALSGIFSALMVGLGRAVGETMIVLMAAGNTPLLDLNIFNGLRTLSANIAVELPEAVKDGTLYRMLFLAALLLFGITFLVNTVAEIIRQRFRRRAYQL